MSTFVDEYEIYSALISYTYPEIIDVMTKKVNMVLEGMTGLMLCIRIRRYMEWSNMSTRIQNYSECVYFVYWVYIVNIYIIFI